MKQTFFIICYPTLLFTTFVLFVHSVTAAESKLPVSVKFSTNLEEFKTFGHSFTGLCDLNGTKVDLIQYFKLSYHFAPKLDQSFAIGYYEVFPKENLNGTFTAVNVDFLGLSIAQENNATFPKYEAQITPKNANADGQYYCSITVKENTHWLSIFSERVRVKSSVKSAVKSYGVSRHISTICVLIMLSRNFIV